MDDRGRPLLTERRRIALPRKLGVEAAQCVGIRTDASSISVGRSVDITAAAFKHASAFIEDQAGYTATHQDQLRHDGY